MQISFRPAYGAARVPAATASAPQTAAPLGVSGLDREVAFREVADALVELRELRDLLGGARPTTSTRPTPVYLDGPVTASSLASAGPIAVLRTEWTDAAPARASGTFDAGFRVRLHGLYGGASDLDLRFRPLGSGVRISSAGGITPRSGGGDAILRYTDGAGTNHDAIFARGAAPGTRVALAGELSGVELELGLEGGVASAEARGNARFEYDAYSGNVDLDADLTGGSAPAFLEGALSAGDFVINGVSIRLRSNDTLRTLLDTISASAAGVSATWDAASGGIALARTTPGADPITLGSDTAGVFRVFRWSAEGQRVGGQTELERPMADVAALSAVTAGDLDVSGVAVAVDPTRDSVLDVLGRIESRAPSVRAVYDLAAGAVRVTGAEVRDAGGTFARTLVGETRARHGTSDVVAQRAAQVIERIGARIERIAERLGSTLAASFDRQVGARFATSSAGAREHALLGLRLGGADRASLSVARGGETLRRALTSGRAARDALVGAGDDRGVLGAIEDALRTATEIEARRVGVTSAVLLSRRA